MQKLFLEKITQVHLCVTATDFPHMYKLHVDTGNSIHTETDSPLRKCHEKQT
jgi:hypothetical protein